MELGLKPGEIRTAKGRYGLTVSVFAVMGGSFTTACVRDAQGFTRATKTFKDEDEALRLFATYKEECGA